MPDWIPVRERLPEEHESVFAELYGTPEWRDSMFKKMSDDVLAVKKFENGIRFVSTLQTRDGVWTTSGSCKVEITHWMPLPQPPEENSIQNHETCNLHRRPTK